MRTEEKGECVHESVCFGAAEPLPLPALHSTPVSGTLGATFVLSVEAKEKKRNMQKQVTGHAARPCLWTRQCGRKHLLGNNDQDPKGKDCSPPPSPSVFLPTTGMGPDFLLKTKNQGGVHICLGRASSLSLQPAALCTSQEPIFEKGRFKPYLLSGGGVAARAAQHSLQPIQL